MLIYVPNVALATIKRELEEANYLNKARIWFGSNGSCFWTHDQRHVHYLIRREGKKTTDETIYEPHERVIAEKHAKSARAAVFFCDPAGGKLIVTTDPMAFLAYAEAHSTQYGKHGFTAFMAAHALNCRDGGGKHTCSLKWREYNDAIDVHLAKSRPAIEAELGLTPTPAVE